MVTILCQRPGYRRAGVAHPARATYPDGTFTADQLEVLRADPVLSVQDGEPEAEPARALHEARQQCADLQAQLDAARAETAALQARLDAARAIAKPAKTPSKS